MVVKRGEPEHILFVVDTDSSAGNFEREMCAYMTGQIGDDDTCKEEAEEAKKEISKKVISRLEEIMENVPDEHGRARPVEIFPNQRYGNNGNGKHALLTAENQDKFPWPAYNSVAIYFSKVPDAEIIAFLKSRATEFAKRDTARLKIEGFRLLEQRTVYKEIPI